VARWHRTDRLSAMWFAGVPIAVLGYAVLCRLALPSNTVVRLMLVGPVAGACLLWRLVEQYGATSPQTWAGALVYAFCCELYLFLFTLAMTSVTAGLLCHLSRRAMTEKEIQQYFDSREIVAARLDRLIAVGVIEEHESGLKVTTKGERLVRAFAWLRELFQHPQTDPSPSR
jgi:hypothetical protein